MAQMFASLTLAQQTGSPSAPAVNAVGVPGAPAASTPVLSAAPAATGGTVPSTGTAAPVGGAAAPGPLGGLGMFLPIILVMGVFIILSSMNSRKEKKKREELMSSMGRGDKVQLAGGIIGTIADLYDNEAVIHLEEGRMRVARASIVTILASKKGAKSVVEAKEPAKAAV